MKKIFEPVTLGKLMIKNRIVRSATMEFGATENGNITPLLMEIHEGLAKGNVGLIITGMMGVGYNSCATAEDMTKIYSEDFVPKFSEIVRRVHEHGSKIIVQLCHCGVRATVIDKGDHAMGPSTMGTAKSMTKEEIQSVIHDFGESASKCIEAGADGVQIHAAQGYLLSELLSPYYNKRPDEYRGSVANRARIIYEVYNEIRRRIGDGYPVFIKINYTDLTEPGFNGNECIWVCKELEKRGIDAVEVSSGIAIDKNSVPFQPAKPVLNEEQEGFFAKGALRLSSAINISVISVGGYRTPAVIERYLNKGNIEAISMCRPLICEPSLIKRWEDGDTSKARCISCSKCFGVKKHGCQVSF